MTADLDDTVAIALRRAMPEDFPAIWAIFGAVIAAGDTYAYDPGMTRDEARRIFFDPPAQAFVAVDGDELAGAYVLKPNQPGLGNHVANCGYVTAPEKRRRGVASAMCAHSLETARALGYTAMQFNFVVASNEGAVKLWQKHGFAIVGRVPAAFRHATRGPTDVLIMHRML
jgi:ribosomal protein S18 acetylase RimI-like enzyme